MSSPQDRVVQVTTQGPAPLTGIYAILVTILLGMFGAAASVFYWGGQIAKGQQINEQQVIELKGKIDYFQAQLQSLDAKVARIEGGQVAAATLAALNENKRRK